jgi:hypothetical protein
MLEYRMWRGDLKDFGNHASAYDIVSALCVAGEFKRMMAINNL